MAAAAEGGDDGRCHGCQKIQQDECLGDDCSAGGQFRETMPSAIPVPIVPPSSPPLDEFGASPPRRVHQLKHDSSVLAIAVNSERIFAGTHDGEILVWSLGYFELVFRIQAHKRSVMCLFLSAATAGGASADSQLLVSSACDAIVSVWCPKTMQRLYEIYSTHSVGDIFSVAYSARLRTVYMGAQNTTIQWVNIDEPARRSTHDSDQHPDRRHHRFFDSKAVGGTSTPRRNEQRWGLIPKAQVVLEVDPAATLQFAHYGYVYCMLMAKGLTHKVGADEEVLVSGSGDGTVKIWRLESQANGHDEQHGDHPPGEIQELMTLGTDDADSVLSIAVDGSFLYCGKLAGVVELWDADTSQRLRVIKAHDGDIMSLKMGWGFLWSAAANGSVSKHSTVHYDNGSGSSPSENVSQKYQCHSRWKAHEGKILASAVTTYKGDQLYISGANDDDVRVWRVNSAPTSTRQEARVSEDMMFTNLREFVSYKTVSSRPEFAEDCRRGATFLCNLFKRMGGEVEMLSTADKHNPVVYAKFSGIREPAEERKRILFYGHYDVVPANNKEGNWETEDPFQLTGLNGYLYGRGVSDNKGPIIAALYAVTDLMQAKQLESDVVFLIEGEEESGSPGFQQTIQENQELIGKVDYVLLANSYWLDDETPCLTYGLRGVLHATVCVDSQFPDLHSGVDGSYMVSEPLSDLTSLLSKLKGPKNRIMIPGFYDGILPPKADEEARYDAIAKILMKRHADNGPAEMLKASLMARWREPNLTIHRYKVSGPDGSLVSSHASANISLRLVPGQEVDAVTVSLTSFLKDRFAALESANSLSIKIDNKAEPWLGDPGNYIFQTLEEAIIQVWDMGSAATITATTTANTAATGAKVAGRSRPLYIREGGSIPAIRFLEKQFGAPAAHLPCGQASDSAHLHNERLRVTNLLKAREIFAAVFRKL